MDIFGVMDLNNEDLGEVEYSCCSVVKLILLDFEGA